MKGKQTKINSKDFRATDSEFWKKHHGYDDKKAEKASDWMSKHYSDLGEAVKINECDINQIVAEALKKCLNNLNETEYASLKSKDTRKGKVGVSKDEDDNYYVDYDGKHYNVPSQKDADKWHEILSIDESRIKAIVMESVKRIISEEQQRRYHWDISTMNDEMEALSHVKSSDALFGEYEGFNGFKTPNAAFNSGLKELKKYSDGSYIMEVWCYVDQENGNPPTTEYVDGYLATNVNGMIRKY